MMQGFLPLLWREDFDVTVPLSLMRLDTCTKNRAIKAAKTDC